MLFDEKFVDSWKMVDHLEELVDDAESRFHNPILIIYWLMSMIDKKGVIKNILCTYKMTD